MENKKLEIPKKPFADFKWKWASVQCTEGINDPVVLLGILFRMAKLEGKYKYSSEQFGNELIGLSHDLQGTGVNVDLERRVGERNIIRNSGQYWKALNLIPAEKTGGIIQGMSGSPVIQNGKFIGAVTNVLVNDPKKGYVVFGDLMIKEMKNID